jgi:hypothetical protein
MDFGLAKPEAAEDTSQNTIEGRANLGGEFSTSSKAANLLVHAQDGSLGHQA